MSSLHKALLLTLFASTSLVATEPTPAPSTSGSAQVSPAASITTRSWLGSMGNAVSSSWALGKQNTVSVGKLMQESPGEFNCLVGIAVALIGMYYIRRWYRTWGIGDDVQTHAAALARR